MTREQAPEGAPGWQGLLDDEDVEAARRCLDRLTAHLERETGPGAPLWQRPPGARLSLASGLPGLALFFAERARAEPGRGFEGRATALLNAAVEAVTECDPLPPRWPGLFGGVTGVGWVAEHLRGWLVDGDGAEALDEALLDWLVEPTGWDQVRFDLVDGLAGVGLYALARAEARDGPALLDRVLDRLARGAQPDPAGGLIWATPPRPGRPAPFGDWHVDLGLAHGLPGVIGLLARARARRRDAGEPILGPAIQGLQGRQWDDPDEAFPAAVDFHGRGEAGRGGWCYGDLGIALVLVQAAAATADPALSRRAAGLARGQALMAPRADVWDDASLCHGSAARAHLFARLYGALGDPLLAEAARTWYRHTFRLAELGAPEQGGFLFWDQRSDESIPSQRPSIGLLTGGAGVGLVLTAALAAHPPRWDRMLLADPVL